MMSHAFIEDKERGLIGIPRGFLYESMTKDHDVVEVVSSGRDWPSHAKAKGGEPWARSQSDDPSELTLVDSMSGDPTGIFSVDDQRIGFEEVMSYMGSRNCADGIVSFPSSWDAAKLCLALVRSLKTCTLVMCVREMAFDRWSTLAGRYLPDARVGYIDENNIDTKGCHIVISTTAWVNDALESGDLRGDEFGLVVSDQLDRTKPVMWSRVISQLTAAKRLGISSGDLDTAGRLRLFSYHLRGHLFAGKGTSLVPNVRRVWSEWRVGGSSRANPQFMSRNSVLDMMCVSAIYNQHVVEQVLLALKAKRRVLVFSERLKHLKLLKTEVDAQWVGRGIYTDYLTDGMSEQDMARASNADVIFSKYSYVREMPDTPMIDTVVLATPVRYPEAAIGCSINPYPGKKSPVVVDMRCDAIPICKDYGVVRDGMYKRVYRDKRGT